VGYTGGCNQEQEEIESKQGEIESEQGVIESGGDRITPIISDRSSTQSQSICKPETRNPRTETETQDPTPCARNPKLDARHPTPKTHDSKLGT